VIDYVSEQTQWKYEPTTATDEKTLKDQTRSLSGCRENVHHYGVSPFVKLKVVVQSTECFVLFPGMCA